MGEKISMDFDTLMGWVAQGARAHGDEYAATWLRDEIVKQPVGFMRALLAVAQERAVQQEPGGDARLDAQNEGMASGFRTAANELRRMALNYGRPPSKRSVMQLAKRLEESADAIDAALAATPAEGQPQEAGEP